MSLNSVLWLLIFGLGIAVAAAALTSPSAVDLVNGQSNPLNVVNLLPYGPIELYPYEFNENDKARRAN